MSDMVAEAKPICLSDVDMKNNETGFVSGWGTTNTSSGISRIVRGIRYIKWHNYV